MKKTLVVVALAALGFLAIPVASQAADTSGFFINGNIGQARVDEAPSTTTTPRSAPTSATAGRLHRRC